MCKYEPPRVRDIGDPRFLTYYQHRLMKAAAFPYRYGRPGL